MPQTTRLGGIALRALTSVGAVAVFLVTQLGGLLIAGHNPLTTMRVAYGHDQLGYLAITANVISGDFDSTEPITRTGVNHYPRLYYTLVGVVARTSGMDSVTAWNVTGLAFQLSAVAILAVVISTISQRWWMGLVAPLTFMTGTFAVLRGDEWFTFVQPLQAVIWGPFGALYSRNAEGAGLSLGVIAVALVAWAWARPTRAVIRWSVTILAAAVVGMLSSFQTYSFLTLTYVLVFGCATAAIARHRHRWPYAAISALLLVGTFVLGPLVSESLGQLPTLIFGLLPAAPGFILAIAVSRGLVAVAGAAAVASAAPQVLWTASGILGGDPFLAYRVASNIDLGVMTWTALVGATPVLVPLVGAAVIGLLRRDVVVVSITVGGTIALTLLTVNDRWGANAEPYRFWINGFFIGGVLSTLAWARILRRDVPAPVTWNARELDSTAGRRSRADRPVVASVLVITAVLYAAALPDVVGFNRSDTMQAVWDPSTDRDKAITALASDALSRSSTALIVTDPCIDPRRAKATSGVPLAAYHLGMAWPENKDSIDAIMAGRNAGTLAWDAVTDTDVRWILTDSACMNDWSNDYRERMDMVAEISYPSANDPSGAERISLWSVSS